MGKAESGYGYKGESVLASIYQPEPDTPLNDPPEHRIFLAPWTVRIHGQAIVTKFKSNIRDYVSGKHIKKYWESRKRFGSRSCDDIDWESLGKAMKSLKQGQRREVTKHVSGFFSTGKVMVRWKKRDFSSCPLCKVPDEDATHVIKCPDKRASALFDEKMDDLDRWMRKRNTHQGLRIVIISRLRQWRHDHPYNTDHDPSDSITEILELQDEIGWEAAFTGCWAKGWAHLQQLHFESFGWKRTGKRWLAALIKKLWNVSWDMWEHRNGILHNREASVLREQEKQLIKTEFELGFDYFPRNLRSMINLSIEDVLKRDPRGRRVWLHYIQNGRQMAHRRREQVQRDKRILQRQRRMMHRFCQSTN